LPSFKRAADHSGDLQQHTCKHSLLHLQFDVNKPHAQGDYPSGFDDLMRYYYT